MTTPPTTLTWQGVVTVSNVDTLTQTGTATLTLTPQGGVAELPALAAGQSGLPPVLRNVYVTQVAPGTALGPSDWTLVSPGSAGVASVYDLNLQVNSGETGAAGVNALITAAADVVGTATNGVTLVYDAVASAFNLQAPPQPTVFAATTANGATNTTSTSVQFAQIGVAAQQYPWRPWVSGVVYCSGTANTQVDLVCRLNDPNTGDIVGYGPGTLGAGPWPTVLVASFQGNAVGAGSTYGLVPAGTPATVYLIAKQVASTNDPWSVSTNNPGFTVNAIPAPLT